MNSLLLAAVLCALPPPGTYSHSQDAAELAAREAAIGAAVEDMFFLKRPIARARLQKASRVAAWIRITPRDDGSVTLQAEGREPLTLRADGTPAPWKGPDGDALTVTLTADAHRMLQRITNAKGGERLNVFTFREDGSFRMDVTITNEQLPRPLKYALTYRTPAAVPPAAPAAAPPVVPAPGG